MTFEDIIKAHEELEDVNNQIISEQKEMINLLQKQVAQLKAIIEKHILNDKKISTLFNDFDADSIMPNKA